MQVTSSKNKSQIYFVMTALIGKLASRAWITTLKWPPRSRVKSSLFKNVCYSFSDRPIVVKAGRIVHFVPGSSGKAGALDHFQPEKIDHLKPEINICSQTI